MTNIVAPCPFDACDGSGFVIDEDANMSTDCRCRVQRISRARARVMGGVIPRRYRGCGFDREPVPSIAPQIVATVRAFTTSISENLDAGRGLWIYGTVGTGKTTLAMIVSRLTMEAGHSVAVYSLPKLLDQIRSTYDDDTEVSFAVLADRLTSVDLLHIDDVGAERATPWVLEQLYTIVNSRYEAERSVVITTNLERDDLAAQIGERVVSRLEEMCEILPLFGTDARRQHVTTTPTGLRAVE